MDIDRDVIDITLAEVAEELDILILGLERALETAPNKRAKLALLRFMALRELLQCLPDLLGPGSVLTMADGKIDGFRQADGTVKQ